MQLSLDIPIQTIWKGGRKVKTFLSASFSCTFCDSFAPTWNNGKFKFVVIFSQTGEWGMCCEECARKGAKEETTIDSWYFQEENGEGIPLPSC